MTLYPDVQKRAQDEIARVVGKDRLPNIDDQDKLVYVGALIKEVLRFAPVAPLGTSSRIHYPTYCYNFEHSGLAHRAMEEDVYMGYRIPQDATVITNIWHVSFLCTH